MLVGHFFRRFFDKDTVQVDGDTLTTVARAIAAVAAPGLVFAFFLQTHYPRRNFWGSLEDQYFFVLFSFVTMGAVTTFAGEMLFPDRIDFLVLTPLPLRGWQMPLAKACALAGFLLLFLCGCNLLGAFFYPLLCRGEVLRVLYAHCVAVGLAGLFAALAVVSVNGLLLCVLDEVRFRIVSPVVQMLSITLLLLFPMHYARAGSAMQDLLAAPFHTAAWLPPIWFLAIYDHLLYGTMAPPFAHLLAGRAVHATLLVGSVAMITWPLAWARTRRRVLEGASQSRRTTSASVGSVVQWLIRPAAARAVFYLIGKTIQRNSRYQIYLALYGGAGLSLAIACATTVHTEAGSTYLSLSRMGLRATLPLLLFWTVAGLRTAFAFPLNLQAAWIFRVTGADTAACAAAARTWVMIVAAGVLSCILMVDGLNGFSARQVLVIGGCGAALILLLTDAFFLNRSIPFIRPRLPGRVNFPLILTLYLGALTPFIYGVVRLQVWLERSLPRLLVPGLLTVAIHVGFLGLYRAPMEVEEQLEGYDGEFQLLGLNGLT
jgi:hypothetical protein